MSEQEQISQLSALFDDELPSQQADLVIRRALKDPQMRQRWQRHYMTGKNAATGQAAGEHVTKRKLKTPKAPLPGLGG